MKYVIFTRPRSMSFMLASMLGDCAGEWFHPHVDNTTINLALGFTDPFRVFNGVVIHYNHIERAVSELQQPYKVIHLVRKDEVARIMSLLAAHATSMWHETYTGDKHTLNLKEVDCVLRFAADNKAKVNIKPDIEIESESLIDGSGLHKVCEFLQRDLADLQPPSCTPSTHYSNIIENWEEVKAHVEQSIK